MERILDYAKKLNYTKYTSTLKEAWRLSIEGLSKHLIKALKIYDDVPELDPDEDFSKDPCAQFGIIEAQRHRSRGINFGMFLGLFKYYKQSYLDLLNEKPVKEMDIEWSKKFVERYYNRVEIGFCVEWNSKNKDDYINELQDANRRLANEKNKYLTIFESISPPVALFDPELYIVNLNFSAAQLFKKSITPGTKYYEAKKKEEKLEWLIKDMDKFLKSDKEEHFLEKTYKTNMQEYVFDIKLKKMLDVSGKFSGIVVVLNDITDRKNAEKALKESEKKYADLYDNAPDMYLSVSAKTAKIIECNQTVIDTLGYKREEIIGRRVIDIYHPDSNEDAKKAFNSFVKTGTVKDAELMLKRKNGTTIYVSLNVTAVKDRKGNISHSRSTWRDISEKKLAEKALRLSEEKYRGLYESSKDGITSTTLDGKIIDANYAFLDMLGYTFDEIKKLDYQNITPKKWHKKETDIVEKQVFSRGYSDEYEKEYIKKDGTVFPISIRVWLIKNENGEPSGMWGIVRDITERKKLEEERLKREKLQGVLEMAGATCHEFNQPLQVLLGYSEILKSTVSDKKNREYVNIIREEIDRMGDLTKKLQKVTRYETKAYGSSKIIDIEESSRQL